MELRPSLMENISYGQIVKETIINFRREPQSISFEIFDDRQGIDKLFENYESKVENLKVGGLHEQLSLIDRRVFATRMLHPYMIKMLGIKHIKGILLYGPPGTGKTLIAR
jgi:ATP-dependent 26S proteasome regulatory subunit